MFLQGKAKKNFYLKISTSIPIKIKIIYFYFVDYPVKDDILIKDFKPRLHYYSPFFRHIDFISV